MKIDYLRFDELSNEQALNIYDRFIFCEYLHIKLMRKESLGISDEAIIDAYQIVAIRADGSRLIDRLIKVILKKTILPKTYCFKRKSQKEKQDCEQDADDGCYYTYFPSVLHLNQICRIINLLQLYSTSKIDETQLEVDGYGSLFVINSLDWMNGAKEVELMAKLGEGAYGSVYKGRMTNTDQIVAVKVIRINAEDEGISSTTLRQITILKKLSHENIVKLISCRIDYESPDPKVHLIFEFVDEDLAKKLRMVRKFDPWSVKNIMRQILEGVNFMHSKKVFHRDLKPQNILISHNGVVKIADFGLSRIVGTRLQTMSKEIQTLWYRSPELLLGTVRYDFSVDIWSIGCIFYELAQGSVLFQTESEIGQIIEIMKQCGTPKLKEWEEIVNLPNFKPTFPKFAKAGRPYTNLCPKGIELLESMIQVNPLNRISISDALKHSFFDK